MSELTRGMRLGPVLRSWSPILAAIALAACAAGPGGSSGGGDGWTEVSAAAALAGVSLLDVTSFGAGFVAVGNAPVAGTVPYGGAFSSTDGSAWAAAPTEPFAGTTASVVGKVSKGLLALGSACSVECGGFESWLSADAVTWAGPVSLSGDTSRPTGFAERGSTIAAISTDLVDPALNHYQGFVDISSDGATWTADPDPQMFDHTGLSGIASDGTRFVIVGSNLLESGMRDGAAWTSSDGKTWAAATDDGSFKGALLQAVAHGAGGYLAVGSVGADGAVWTSADGTSWTRVDGGGFKASPLADVATSGAGYLALGRDPNGGAAWTSADGKTWKALAGIPGMSDAKVIAAAIGVSKSIIVGQPIGSAASGLVWVGPLP